MLKPLKVRKQDIKDELELQQVLYERKIHLMDSLGIENEGSMAWKDILKEIGLDESISLRLARRLNKKVFPLEDDKSFWELHDRVQEMCFADSWMCDVLWLPVISEIIYTKFRTEENMIINTMAAIHRNDNSLDLNEVFVKAIEKLSGTLQSNERACLGNI
jgi:hypothetical protein